ncbi:hypothetical protein ABKN59_006114 [Abortiporus biennis]
MGIAVYPDILDYLSFLDPFAWAINPVLLHLVYHTRKHRIEQSHCIIVCICCTPNDTNSSSHIFLLLNKALTLEYIASSGRKFQQYLCEGLLALPVRPCRISLDIFFRGFCVYQISIDIMGYRVPGCQCEGTNTQNITALE